MSSFFGWVDHDPEHERAVLRSLGSASGQDARDELGLGAIRDSFADTFFPGLSTIQQRPRYFLFVQWCCELAAEARGEAQVLDRLRRTEVDLIRTLTPLGEGAGVIGLNAQENLERMPSEIYWSGLGLLGLRRVPGSTRRWARHVATHRALAVPSVEGDAHPAPFDNGFDPARPAPPERFPNTPGLRFELSEAEATFLRSRLGGACVDPGGRGLQHNLMAPFAPHRRATRVRFPWEHPRAARLPTPTREILALAASFSRVMLGAVILYNRTVAELKLGEGGALDVRDRHAVDFARWARELDAGDVVRLRDQFAEVTPLAVNTRHTIRHDAAEFVRRWTELCQDPDVLPASETAVRLVSNREVQLKAKLGTSRIRSLAARVRWRGDSGGALDYRWGVARLCLNDLATAG